MHVETMLSLLRIYFGQKMLMFLIQYKWYCLLFKRKNWVAASSAGPPLQTAHDASFSSVLSHELVFLYNLIFIVSISRINTIVYIQFSTVAYPLKW